MPAPRDAAPRRSAAVRIALAFAAAAAAAAPPAPAQASDIDAAALFPAGAERGTSITASIAGKIARWPLDVWSSDAALAARPGDERGTLRIDVAADAPPGTRWLRLHDAAGASALIPFIVGVLPETVEKEPDDSIDDAMEIDSPRIVNGRLEKRGDVDGFRVRLDAGRTLVAAVDAHAALGSPMDAVLQVATAAGFTAAQVDDAPDFDPVLAFTAPASASYVVRVFAFPAQPDSSIQFAGGEGYIYRLTLTADAYADHPWPLAIDRRGPPAAVELRGFGIDGAGADGPRWQPSEEALRSAAHGDAIALDVAGRARLLLLDMPCSIEGPLDGSADPPRAPFAVSGRISRDGEVDTFAFRGARGDALALSVRSRALGFDLDAVLAVVGPDGKEIARADDNKRGAAAEDPEIDVTLPADGVYEAVVRDLFGHGGPRHTYLLAIEAARQDFEISVDADRFTTAPDKPLQIPVTIRRRNGMKSPIAIRCEGLPESIAAPPATSMGEGDTAGKVTLTLGAAGAAARAGFRIVGEAEGLPSRAAHTGSPPRRRPDLWLTVSAP